MGDLKAIVASTRETREYQPLIRAIGLVFSDPVRVDAGFAKPAAAASGAAEVGDDSKMETDESAGAPASLGGGSDSASAPLAIDIDNVAEAYRIVFAAADEAEAPALVLNALDNALNTLVFQLRLGAGRLDAIPAPPVGGEATDAAAGFARVDSTLRQFLVVLEHPRLIDPCYTGLLSVLFAALDRLSTTAKERLVHWLASESCGLDRFRRWLALLHQVRGGTRLAHRSPDGNDRVRPFAQFIIYLLNDDDSRRPSHDIALLSAVRIIALLHRANVQRPCAKVRGARVCADCSHAPIGSRSPPRRIRTNQVDEADFYNDQINERLQEEDGAMREEYVKWRKHDLPRIARARQEARTALLAALAEAAAAATADAQAGSASPGPSGAVPPVPPVPTPSEVEIARATDVAVTAVEMESIISFPFILEPATKARVLTLDSTEEMRRQVCAVPPKALSPAS